MLKYTQQGVAQWLSALALGARGRAFESLHPETINERRY